MVLYYKLSNSIIYQGKTNFMIPFEALM